MNASQIVSLAGFARQMPDVLTFVTPVFHDALGNTLMQVSVDGGVAGFEPIHTGEEFVDCALHLALGVGEPMLACLEVAPYAFLVGSSAALCPLVQELVAQSDDTFAESTRGAMRRFLAGPIAIGHDLALLIRVGQLKSSPMVVSVPPGTAISPLLRQLVGREVGNEAHSTDLQRSAEERVRRLANIDALTGLPNFRQMTWRTEQAIGAARRLGHQAAVVVLELKPFNELVEYFGYQSREEVLVEVAKRLRTCLQHNEYVNEQWDLLAKQEHKKLEGVGRGEGEKFVALLPYIADSRAAESLVSRAFAALSAPVRIAAEDMDYAVSAVAGLACFPRDGDSAAGLIRHADAALSSAVESGLVLVRPAFARDREIVELAGALTRAMERNELVLHYQPQIDLVTNSVVGVEALVRWSYGGILRRPGEFIPLAEEHGVIVRLSTWVIHEVLRQINLWRDQLPSVPPIAVNLPSTALASPELIEEVRRAWSGNRLAEGALVFEISEDSLMRELAEAIPAMHQLAELGVRISIDDFGTGYSSLAYLTTLPISEVKIDRSFIRDLGITPQSSGVVSAILALARTIDLRTVAEGVETPRQMEVLERLGCEVMQGTLFCKPQPADQLTQWLRHPVLPRRRSWSESAVVLLNSAWTTGETHRKSA